MKTKTTIPKGPKKKPKDAERPNRNTMMWVIGGLVILYLGVATLSIERQSQTVPYNQFFGMLLENQETGRIASAALDDNRILGKFDDGSAFTVYIPEGDSDLIPTLRQNISDFSIKPPWAWANLFYSFAPMLLFIFLFWFLIYRGAQQGGGRILSFGKSQAKQFSQDKIQVTFKDVAGVNEAKDELQEIIEFLKEPKKFQNLGGKIPKGVLLMGPPGTGKTLLAKAVAGEAHVPYFSISGSDFVEMFVGVGASRVRDLFEQGKRAAKASGRGCIIFIDEIDAVGRQRFAGIGGGHDEREQTLNALLVEMDGFDTQIGVILLAATNRPDVLDPALVRPGRFDRQIVIDKPDIVGREGILKVHARNVKLAKSVNLKSIARQTPGFSGADLANLVNEGALLAARRGKKAVEQIELEGSIERVMAGPERKSRVISKQEKVIVAHHEAGHTLVALKVPKADPVHKVSIIPRGTAALGYTLQMPLEDRYLVSKTELLDRLTVLMGGRVAEELIFQEITSGAQNDIEVATAAAHRMVCEFGMSEKLGPLTFGRRDRQVFLGRDIMQDKDYSETTAVLIDQEVRGIIDGCYKRAKTILTENIGNLKKLAERLLESEVLKGDEVRQIIGMPSLGSEDNADKAKPGSQEKSDEK